MVDIEEIKKWLEKGEKELNERGVMIHRQKFMTGFANAKELFSCTLRHVAGEDAEYLQEYDEVAEWLRDNNGKSLMLMGQCGVGKSMIACRIIPLMFACRERIFPPISATAFSRLDTIDKRNLWIIDDLGTERVVKDFGTEKDNVSELIEMIDSCGNCAVITTNLTSSELKHRYGDRNFDRLRANFKIVAINHASMRR